MIARMRPAPRRLCAVWLAMLLAAWLPGCAGHGRRHEASRVPDRGEIDPEQARELDKVTMPQYVVEPPDELEVAIKPSTEDFSGGTVVVQQDGVIDLGLLGDIYVVGASLEEIEGRIAQRLNEVAVRSGKRPQPYRVSARLANSQSKYYYVMGAVTTQGKVPIKGNETVLDAILQAGLRSNSLPDKAYLVRPHLPGMPDQVLKIDWCGIRERGDTLTNYQLFPGDRVVVPGTKPPGLIATLLGQ